MQEKNDSGENKRGKSRDTCDKVLAAQCFWGF